MIFLSMKWWMAAFVAVTLIFAPGCTRKGKARDMDPKEAQGMLANRLGILVDVREEEELRETGIAEGAVWMPTSKIAMDHPDWRAFLKELSRDKIVMLYCRSGARSGQVASFLATEGYNTANVGGFKDWQDAKLPWKKFP